MLSLGNQIDVRAKPGMVWRSDVSAPIVQALEAASVAEQRARLATARALRVLSVVFDIVAGQQRSNVDVVGERENRIGTAAMPRR